MKQVPILIESAEAASSSETWLCSQATEKWLSYEYGPIGFVTNIQELDQLLIDVVDNGLDPSIFVVNTYAAKDMLKAIDERVCEKPMLFLRRRLFAGKSGFHEVFGDPTLTGIELEKFRPRISTCWFYGGKTVRYMAGELCERIFRFQKDGDFRGLENQPDDVC